MSEWTDRADRISARQQEIENRLTALEAKVAVPAIASVLDSFTGSREWAARYDVRYLMTSGHNQLQGAYALTGKDDTGPLRAALVEGAALILHAIDRIDQGAES